MFPAHHGLASEARSTASPYVDAYARTRDYFLSRAAHV